MFTINPFLAGSGNTAEYQAVLDNALSRYIRRPTAKQQADQNTFFAALKAAGIMTLTDMLKVHITNGPVNFTSINWVNPALYYSTRIKAPQFIRNDAFKFGGAALTDYIDTGWAPSNGVNYTLNSSEMAFYYKDLTAGLFVDGVRDNSSGLNGTVFNPFSASGQCVVEVNGGQVVISNAQFDGTSDLYFIGRTSSSQVFARRGSNSRVTASSTSDGRTTRTFKIGTLDTNGAFGTYHTRKIAIVWAGGLLTTTQETAFKTAVDAYIAAVATDPAAPSLGTIHNQTSFPNLNGWSSNGTTPTVVSNELQFTGGAFGFAQTLDFNTWGDTALENWEITIRVTVGTKVANSFGFAVGVRSTHPTLQYDACAQFIMNTGADGGKARLHTGANGTYTARGDTTANTFNVGDVISLRLVRAYNVLMVYNQNETTPSGVVTASYTYASTVILPNTSRFSIFNIGGTFTLKSVNITSSERYQAYVCQVGNSKTSMYYASLFNLRFATLNTDHLGVGPVLGGGGDRSAEYLRRVNEIVALAPQNVVIYGASNDPRFSVPAATTQANLAAFESTLTAAGIRVIWSTGLYETSGVNQATLQAWIIANYLAANIIDTLPTVIGLNGDFIHPNDAGHATTSTGVLTAGKV